MKQFFKIGSAVCAALLMLALSVSAQSTNSVWSTTAPADTGDQTLTNGQVLLASSISNNAFSVMQSTHASFQVTATSNSPNVTNNVVVTLDPSIDGIHWQLAWQTITLSVQSTNTCSIIASNWNVGGFPYLRVEKIDNSACSSANNTTLVDVVTFPKNGY
jgi:hypothetical protein